MHPTTSIRNTVPDTQKPHRVLPCPRETLAVQAHPKPRKPGEMPSRSQAGTHPLTPHSLWPPPPSRHLPIHAPTHFMPVHPPTHLPTRLPTHPRTHKPYTHPHPLYPPIPTHIHPYPPTHQPATSQPRNKPTHLIHPHPPNRRPAHQPSAPHNPVLSSLLR